MMVELFGLSAKEKPAAGRARGRLKFYCLEN